MDDRDLVHVFSDDDLPSYDQLKQVGRPAVKYAYNKSEKILENRLLCHHIFKVSIILISGKEVQL
eukprot:UN20100